MWSRFSLLAVLAAAPACSSGAAPCTGAACADAAAPDPLAVTTDRGPIAGKLEGDTHAFLGIPYAAPPLGDLRWKPPAPHAAWTTPLDATQKGPWCRQLGIYSGVIDETTSEDCLTLDVWTPATRPASPAPVLVWIHGGSFAWGSGSQPDFDGQKLSEATGSVVVTLNYRLGPLGFLAYIPLASEDPGHPSTGLYGIEDQRAAMSWVQKNAAAFGGDPANVTIFGESAGGFSVCYHLVSPKSTGFFQRAIVESGACTIDFSPTAAQAKAQGDALAAALGCSDPACLRGKSADEVLLALPLRMDTLTLMGATWFPAPDGWNLPDVPATLIAQGSFAKVPLLLGSNGDEGSAFFLGGGPTVATAADFTALMESRFPGHGQDILGQYPLATFPSPKDAAVAAVGDGAFVCPTRRLARAYAGAKMPTHLYHFVHVTAAGLSLGLGAYHSIEVGFVFGNPTTIEDAPLTVPEQGLASAMMGYWGRMAASGDPNGGGAPAWPAYDATSDQDLVLDLTIAAEPGLKKARCDFWDTLAP